MVSNKIAVFTGTVAMLIIIVAAYPVSGCTVTTPQSDSYDFLISTDGAGHHFAKNETEHYFAKNGTTGKVVYSGANASTIFNSAIKSLPSSHAETHKLTSTINMNETNVLLRGAGSSTILNHTGFHSISAVETSDSLYTKNQIINSSSDAIATAQDSHNDIISNNVVNNTVSAVTTPQSDSYDFLISTDGAGNYFAKNGATGQVAYSGTDAASVFNSVISGLPSGGGSIFVDSGTYALTGPINVNKNNIVLRGAGSSTELKVASGGMAGQYQFLIYVFGANNVVIENLKFTGVGHLDVWNHLIQSSYNVNLTVQNCHFYYAGGHAIFAVETDYSLFTNNQVYYSVWDAIALAQGSDHNIISNNFVTNTSNMHDMNGIDINGKAKASTFNTIIGNTILWSHGGICFDTACNNIAQGNTIAHVILGIDNTGAGGTTATTDNQLIGNTISYSEGANFGLAGYNAGIQISHLADRTTVTGNIISNFADRCILLNSNGNTITGNTFKDSPVGMAVGSGLTGNVLAPNTYINVPAGN